jgi:hypothetical protein
MAKKSNNMLWEAADAMTDRLLGIQRSKPQDQDSTKTKPTQSRAKSDPHTESVIQSAREFLEDRNSTKSAAVQSEIVAPPIVIAMDPVTTTEPHPTSQPTTTVAPSLAINHLGPPVVASIGLGGASSNPVTADVGTQEIATRTSLADNSNNDSSPSVTTISTKFPIEVDGQSRLDKQHCTCDFGERYIGIEAEGSPSKEPVTPESGERAQPIERLAETQTSAVQQLPHLKFVNPEARELPLIQNQETTKPNTHSISQFDQEIRSSKTFDERLPTTADDAFWYL